MMGTPDADGHVIPIDAKSGTAVLSNTGGQSAPMNVGASVGTFNVRRGTCGTTCPTCLGYSDYYVDPGSFSENVGDDYQLNALALQQNGVWVNKNFQTSWGSSNSSIGSSSGSGKFHGVAAGSFQATASIYLLDENPDCPYNGAPCPRTLYSGWTAGAVTPTISGPSTVWWFNGENPDATHYPTSITLTAAGGSTASWTVTNGSARINISPSGNTASITSSGNYWSGAVGDISITATVNGETSAAVTLTSRRPWKLVPQSGSPNTECEPENIYSTFITYDLHDNLDDLMPYSVGWNEALGTKTSEHGSNWASFNYFMSGGDTNPVIDNLQPPDPSVNPSISPTPVCPTSSDTQRYMSRTQTISVGNSSTGGVPVQTDYLGYYIDHGSHDGITVPSRPPY